MLTLWTRHLQITFKSNQFSSTTELIPLPRQSATDCSHQFVYFTGLHQERAYTCLGVSCLKCIRQYNCFPSCICSFSIHIFWCMHWTKEHNAYTKFCGACIVLDCEPWIQCIHFNTIQMHICMRRKQLDRYMHCGQEIAKQVYILS